jgi:hypothetical protein
MTSVINAGILFVVLLGGLVSKISLVFAQGDELFKAGLSGPESSTVSFI